MRTATLKLHSVFVPIKTVVECEKSEFVSWMMGVAQLHGVAGLRPVSMTEAGCRYLPASLDTLLEVQAASLQSAVVAMSGRMN